MATLIKTLLILKPNKLNYVLIDLTNSEPALVRAVGFPIYSSDLALGVDRYPEYELIKHLPTKDIFEYFVNPPTTSTQGSNNDY